MLFYLINSKLTKSRTFESNTAPPHINNFSRTRGSKSRTNWRYPAHSGNSGTQKMKCKVVQNSKGVRFMQIPVLSYGLVTKRNETTHTRLKRPKIVHNQSWVFRKNLPKCHEPYFKKNKMVEMFWKPLKSSLCNSFLTFWVCKLTWFQ